MRHGKGLRKLNRTSSHRKALLMNMAVSLFKHEQIKTTLPKAKTLKPFAEKLITKAKKKDLHTIRQLHAVLHDAEIVKKLIDDIAPRSAERAGGYTRIYKFGFRYGDAAPMAILELVDKQVSTKKPSATKKKIADKPDTSKPVQDKQKPTETKSSSSAAKEKPKTKKKAPAKAAS
jgi:large subunit ribosomal protein L17